MSVALRLATLREHGAARFDPSSLALVEGLHARALEASPAVRDRLWPRLQRHLFSLELRLDGARAEALRAIEGCHAHLPRAAAAARDRLAEGDVPGALALLNAAQARLRSPLWLHARDRLERTLAQVRERCQPAPPEVDEAQRFLENPDLEEHAVERAQTLAHLLLLALLHETAERSCVQLEVDRLQRATSADAGPYNATALAALALDTMAQLSPTYLRSYLQSIADLEVLCRLPPTPAETAKPAKPPRAPAAASKGARSRSQASRMKRARGAGGTDQATRR